MKKLLCVILCLLLVGCGSGEILPPASTVIAGQTETSATRQPVTQPSVTVLPALPTGTELPAEPSEETAPPTMPADTVAPDTNPTVPSTAPTAPPQTTPPSTPVQTVPTTPPTVPTTPVQTREESIKAIWLTQFDLEDVYKKGETQREKKEFTKLAETIMENIASMGFNTVFLQLRPNADSMYPSEVYPMSKYVVGQYGGSAAYDPVAILVTLAREKGLSVHGWINPYRAMKEQELSLAGEDHTLGQWAADPDKLGDYLVLYKGTWYLNPAYPEVRQLIAAGSAEAMTRYGLDGLHIDDYFYPTTDEAFDRSAYEKLGGGRSLAAFRRENVSALVSLLYETAHAAGGVFSVSPAGNIGTVYESHYADVYTWCSEEGYLDYICPQVYFGLEHQTYDFVSVCRTFSEIIKTDSVKLLVGMTFGKALSGEDPYAGSGKNEWKTHSDVLKRSLETTRALPNCRGVAVFCYQYLYDPVTGKTVEQTRLERENFLPVLQTIRWEMD